MKLSFNTWVYSSFPVWVPAYTIEETIKRIAGIGYDGIEIGATAHQNLERLIVGRLAERPGRDNERSLRRIRRLIRRQGFWQSSVADHNQRSPAHELSS